MKTSLLLGFVDQAVLSACSLLLLIAAAQHYTPGQLGAFTSGIVTTQLLIIIVRSVAGEPLLVVPTDQSMMREQDQGSLSLVVGITLGLVPIGIWLLVFMHSSSMKAVGAALASLIFVATNDQLRYVLIRRDLVAKVLVRDCVMVSMQLVTVYACARSSVAPSVTVMVCGLVPGVLASASIATSRQFPSYSRLLGWFHTSKRFASSFATEAIVGTLGTSAWLASLIAFGSLNEVAAFRSASSLFGITTLALAFLRTNVLSHLGRSGVILGRMVLLYFLAMSSFIALSIGSVMLLLLTMSDAWGQRLLGETWAITSPILPAAGLFHFVAALTVVPTVLLRGMRIAWEATRIRMVIEIANIGIVVWCVKEGGLLESYYGLTVSVGILVLTLMGLVAVRLRKPPHRFSTAIVLTEEPRIP